MPLWLLAIVCLAGGQAEAGDRPVFVGVVYSAAAATPAVELRDDLEAIRAAGYNAVVPAAPASEPRIAALAGEAGLAVRPLRPAEGESHARISAGAGTRAAAQARVAFWEAVAEGVRDIAFAAPGGRVSPEVLALGETAGIVTRNPALFGPLAPRAGGVRSISTGPSGPVEVRLLESADALMIIGVSASPSPQTVTIEFASEIPEAIWQNLETGTSVNFVMGKDGPSLEHTFAPRDSLVLMIRKRLRR